MGFPRRRPAPRAEAKTTFKIGAVAARAGVSVRTLHYWEETGLLVPSARSESGHRLYTEADLARLQQILSLRSLGLGLPDIARFLDDGDFSPVALLEVQAERLEGEIEARRQLRDRLLKLAETLRAKGRASAEELFHTMEGITMIEKYFTPEQITKLTETQKKLQEQEARTGTIEWKELLAKIRAEHERGTPVDSEKLRPLIQGWMQVGQLFHGGDPKMIASLRSVYEKEEAFVSNAGLTPEVRLYISQAARALGLSKRKD